MAYLCVYANMYFDLTVSVPSLTDIRFTVFCDFI